MRSARIEYPVELFRISSVQSPHHPCISDSAMVTVQSCACLSKQRFPLPCLERLSAQSKPNTHNLFARLPTILPPFQVLYRQQLHMYRSLKASAAGPNTTQHGGGGGGGGDGSGGGGGGGGGGGASGSVGTGGGHKYRRMKNKNSPWNRCLHAIHHTSNSSHLKSTKSLCVRSHARRGSCVCACACACVMLIFSAIHVDKRVCMCTHEYICTQPYADFWWKTKVSV